MTGVTERRAGFNESLRLIGKQDEKGAAIGISYFSGTSLKLIPLAIRVVGLVVLLGTIFFQQPFGWLPIGPDTPEAIVNLQSWQSFSTGTWLIAVVIYLMYLGVTLVKNGIYTGQPGAEIHFTRHKKIIKTLRAGEFTLIVDPRVSPYAVVSTKPFVLYMDPVEGKGRGNISLTFRGALILRVHDTFKLLEQGGFGKLLRQIEELYQSMIKDAILQVHEHRFNRFMIESVDIPASGKASITARLEQLESADLDVDLLTTMSEIDELDVSSFELTEVANPHRRSIIAGLQRLADAYGITVIDHVPQGSLTSEDYLKTLALPLVSSIARLRQATETLREIVQEEIDEEITASVAKKRIGALEIQKIIQEIEAVTATLRDKENQTSIVEAREAAMRNIAEGLLASVEAELDSFLARIRAKEIDTAGLDRYLTELETLYTNLEEHIAEFVPQVQGVVTDRFDQDQVLPEIDVVGELLTRTGTKEALDKLKQQLNTSAADKQLEQDIAGIEQALEKVDVESSMATILRELDKVSSDSGVSTARYSPDNVSRLIDEIAKKADVELTTETAPVA